MYAFCFSFARFLLFPQAGVRVSGIKPNSTSDKAGLRVGDVILEVNEVCLISSTHAAVKDAVKVASAGGGAVRIKVCSRAHADRVVADAAAAPVPVPVHPQPAGKGVPGTSDVASLATGLKPLGGEAVIDTVAAIDGGGGGGAAATEPCTSYKLDMAAAIFGMCKCGFPKQKHTTTQAPPGKSKPPAARPYGLSMPAQAPAPEAAAMSNVPKPASISRTSSNEALPVPTSSLLSPTSPSTSPTRSHARPKPRPRSMFVLPTEVSVEPTSASSTQPPTSPHFSTPAPVTRLLAASAAPLHTPPPPPPPQPSSSEEAGAIARTHTPPHPPPSPPLPTAVAPGGLVAAASTISAHTDADTPGPPGPAPEMPMASQKNTVQTSNSSITTTAATTTGSISTSTSTSSEAVGLKLRIVELEALVMAANAKAEGAALETSGVVQKLAESAKAAEAAEARALNAEAGKSQTEALLAEAASTESNQAAELRAKLAALQSDLSVATAAAHQHTAGFTKAKASLDFVNAEKEKLLAENATLRSKVEQLQTDLTEVQNDKEESLELATATAVLQSKLESSARAIASEQERTAVVETEKMALIEQIAQLQTHAEMKAAEANKEVSDLTVEVSKLKAAVTTAASTAAAKLSAATGAAAAEKKVLEASSAVPVPVSTSTPAAIPASTVASASPVKDSTAAAIAAALAAKNNGSSTPAPAPVPGATLTSVLSPLPPREDAPKPAQSSSSPAKDSTAAAIAAALAAKSNFTTTAGEHATSSTPPPPVVAAPRPRPSAKPKKSAPTIKQRPVTMFEKASPEKADTSAIEPIDGVLHLRPKPGKKVRPMSVMATHGKLGASLEGLLGRGPMPGMGMVRPKSREGSSSDSLGASPPKPKPSARTARPQSMFVTSSSSPIPGARLRPGTGEFLAKSPPTGDDVFEGLAVPSSSRLDSTAQMDRRSASMSAKTKRRPPSRKMMKGRARPVSSFHIKSSPLKEAIFEDETTGSAEMLPLGKAPSAPAGTKPSLLIVGVDATAAAESSTDGAEEQSAAVPAIEALLEDTCDTGEDTGEDIEEKKKKKKGGMHKLKKMRKGLFGKKSSSKEAA